MASPQVERNISTSNPTPIFLADEHLAVIKAIAAEFDIQPEDALASAVLLLARYVAAGGEP